MLSNRTPRPKLALLYSPYLVYGMAFVYVITMFVLMVLKHNAFNTRIHDFARFSNAIWNTLDGRFLYTSLSERSILGDHFSPIMAIAAPFLWLFQDERVLFLIQAINVAAAGLILYHLARARHPNIAPIIALVFFLNPAIHELTLFELRRIVFGMPWLALGMYGLVQKRRGLMLVGLLVALLAKESIALYVLMIGVYLFVIERDWKWGVGLAVLGLGWAWIVGDIVIGAFNQSAEVYPQLYYYDHLGTSYSDIVKIAFTDPMRLIDIVFSRPQLLAVFRVLLPFFFLVLLDIPILLLASPFVALMFLSRDVDMYQLDKWYMTTITPVLFAALIKGWQRIPARLEKPAAATLLIATCLSFLIYSYAPLGGRFDAATYTVDDRDRHSEKIIERVPDGVVVESHSRFIPHLTHLNEVYHYGNAEGKPVDYILLDATIPFLSFDEQGDLTAKVMSFVADPNYVISEENDGTYLFGLTVPDLPAWEVGKSAESAILLDRFEIAVQDSDGFFQPTMESQFTAGQTVRVTLYWEALKDEIAERTVSVRISAEDDFLLTQQDQIPLAGFRPTSWWQTGQKTRDVYYLTLPSAQPASLDIVLYDTYTGAPVLFTNEDVVMQLLPITIRQP